MRTIYLRFCLLLSALEVHGFIGAAQQFVPVVWAPPVSPRPASFTDSRSTRSFDSTSTPRYNTAPAVANHQVQRAASTATPGDWKLAESMLLDFFGSKSAEVAAWSSKPESARSSKTDEDEPPLAAWLDRVISAKPMPQHFDKGALVGDWHLEYTNELHGAIRKEAKRHINTEVTGISVMMSVNAAGEFVTTANVSFADGDNKVVSLRDGLKQLGHSPRFTLSSSSTASRKQPRRTTFVKATFLSKELLVLQTQTQEEERFAEVLVSMGISRIPRSGAEVWRRLGKSSRGKQPAAGMVPLWRFGLSLEPARPYRARSTPLIDESVPLAEPVDEGVFWKVSLIGITFMALVSFVVYAVKSQQSVVAKTHGRTSTGTQEEPSSILQMSSFAESMSTAPDYFRWPERNAAAAFTAINVRQSSAAAGESASRLIVRWRQLGGPMISPPRSGHCAAADGNGGVWLFSGYAEYESTSRSVVSDLWHYSSATNRWELCSQATDAVSPSARLVAASAVIDGEMLLFGGWDPQTEGTGGVILDDICALELASQVWSPCSAGFPRGAASRHVACTVGGTVVVHTHRCLTSVLVWDAATRSLVEKPTSGEAPSSRGLHVATAVGSHTLVIFGGAAQDGTMFNDSFALNTETWTWRPIAQHKSKRPTPRAGACAAPLEDLCGMVICCGAEGIAGGGLNPRADVWALVFPEGEDGDASWTLLLDDCAPGAPRPRNAASLTSLGKGKGMLLHGGWNPFKETFADSFILEVDWADV
eukprot:TRINITY_DN12697_c0_g3_i2.p1 TRINITY_DN12697_c0_g3~~TRINITY_DN12697_c0_g3_i2.p1  ORF type:complete len:761 (-),score=92.92 TRINITY_DN12697_c0_g3_i2:428-2710(-)